MKNIFSRKHDTQTGNSKFKFWERSASKPVPIPTDNTRDIQIPSRATSTTNLRPSAGEDKPTVSGSTAGPFVDRSIFPTTRTHTVPQANFPTRPPSSRHRDNNEPPRAGYPPTFSHEREDRAKGFRRVPSGNSLAPKHRTELWPPPQSSKQPGPLDDRYRVQPFQEDTERRRYRNEGKPDARYGVRTESSKAKESREGDEDRFTREQFREDYGTVRDRHTTNQRARDKDRARESEPEREKDKLRQRERESLQREYEKERERQKGERQLREEQERERVRQQDMEKERERDRQNELEREIEKERQRELERERQREEERQRQKEERERERERQRQRDERQREKQRELEKEREKEREKQKEMERERQMQKERERERLMELEKERERQREMEKEREKELERQRLREEREREFEKERERQRELERQRLKEERERQMQKERERERERLMELEREQERERQRELEKEREKERERLKELEREKLREERERLEELERARQKEFEKERERQKDLERERIREERERERQRLKERERERLMELERERERERQKEEREREKQKERERERLMELERERERERQKERERERERLIELERERERERQKEEREREKQKERERERERLIELERERERERQKEEREREKQKERERERLMELERERERERQKEKERERERLIELERERERERQKEEREWEKQKERERERERLMELERERERQKEEREREKQKERERERLMELERERQKEEREREKQKERERERLMELERERERQKEEREREKQKEREQERERLIELERERERQKEERERERQKEREQERERLVELERERERVLQKEEKERERQKEIEREREREQEKQKELQRLKDLEREKVKEQEQERHKELEQQREKERRGKDRGKRGMARNRARGRERQDREEHDREGLRHEGREREKQQEPVITAKQSIVDLKPKGEDNGVDPSHRDSDRAEEIIKAGIKTVEVKPVGGENHKEKAVRDLRGQEHYRQAKGRPETMDGNQDRLRTKTGWDRERRKEGKFGRISDEQQRSFKQLRHERPPVADGWGDSSDDSEDQMLFLQSGSKHDRAYVEKVPQSRQDNSAGKNILAPGNEFRLNQPPTNPLPSYATPRVAPIPLASIDLSGRDVLPLASNLVNFGITHENESARKEINWSKPNREDAELLKATESRPPSRVSFVQTTNPMQITPSQNQNPIAQLKDVQPSSLHAKVRSEDLRAQNVLNELPVNTFPDSWSNVAQEAVLRPVDGKVLKTLPDPLLESSKEVPSMGQMGTAQRNDAHKGKRTTADAATPAPINSRLPTEAHPTPMQTEEKVPRTAPPQVQNTPPSVSMDVERPQVPLVRSKTTDAPMRTWVSSVTPMPDLAISVLPTSNSATVSSTIPSVDSRTQVLASLSPPGTQVHPVNYQSTRSFTNNSTSVFMTPATQTSAPQVRPPSSYGNYPTVTTAPPSQKPFFFRPPSPTSAFPSPHDRESASLPAPSETFTGPFSAPPVNASLHIRVPQSSASNPMSEQMSSLATPNWDRVAARQETREFTGSKADSPLLPKKDESSAKKLQFVQIPSENMVAYAERITDQRPQTRVLPLDVPGDHSIPSFGEARAVHRRVQHHDVEPSRLDNTTGAGLKDPSRVVGLVSQNATTRAGTEVLEKTAEKSSTNHGNGGSDVLTGMAPLGPTPNTHRAPVKYWEGPFATPVVDAQNQMRVSTEVGRIGRDNKSQQTPDTHARHVDKPAASSNIRTREASDKEQVELSIGHPHTSSGFRRKDASNHYHHHKPLESQPLDQTNIISLQGEGSGSRPPTRISWKKSPDEAVSEEQANRQDARCENQAVTSNMRLSMVNGPKTDHNRAPLPTPPLIATQPLEPELLQVSDPIGIPARPVDRSPKRSLLPQTAEIRASSSKVPSPEFNNGTRPKEVVPLVTGVPNKKVDAMSFSLTPGVISANTLPGLKKDGLLARQSVVNTPMPAHSPFQIDVDGPGKYSNHSPSAQTYNPEHVVPSSETIPPHSEIREPRFSNVCHAPVVPTTLESSSTPVEIAPRVKIRHPIGVDGVKQGMDVSLSSRTPILSGTPETATVTSIPTIPLVSQTLEVRPKASFSKGPVGVSNAKSQSRNQHNDSPEMKLLKVEDVPLSSFAASTKFRSDDFDGHAKKRSSNRESPRIKKAEPSLRGIRDTDEHGNRKPSSKKVTVATGDEGVPRQDVQVVVPVVSSRQDNTEQLRSSKLSTLQLPVIGYQAESTPDIPQTKIQHPVLAELLSSPQAAPMAQLTTPGQASDNGYLKEGKTVHLGTTTPGIQSKLHGTPPPERHRQDLEQKMKEAAPISRPSHRKSSSATFHTGEIPPHREHHQLRTAVDMSRVKLARTSDQVDHDQRKNTENSNTTHASRGSRIMSQEPNPNLRTPRLVQQPLQHGQGRHQHSVSLPTSSAIPVQELPDSVTPSDYANQGLARGKPDMGHAPSDKHVLSPGPPSGSQETILMTPASFAPSLALKQTDSRQSNAESVNLRDVKKIRRFKLPPAQSHQVWHPGTSSKTPNSSPSQSSGVGTPLPHNLNLKDPNKTHSVPFPVPKGKAAIAPFNYVTHRMKRSVSGASMEARNGTAPSTILGSPNASMHSSTPLPPPPTRDTWKATHDWVSKGEDRVQAQPKRKRPRPGVVFDTDEDAPEDKQRPRRTLTKHRNASKRHESSNP